jgi:hypothetical protein
LRAPLAMLKALDADDTAPAESSFAFADADSASFADFAASPAFSLASLIVSRSYS